MPLSAGKSKAAFAHNIAAELRAGKPLKQAVAIAYAKRTGDAGGREDDPSWHFMENNRLRAEAQKADPARAKELNAQADKHTAEGRRLRALEEQVDKEAQQLRKAAEQRKTQLYKKFKPAPGGKGWNAHLKASQAESMGFEAQQALKKNKGVKEAQRLLELGKRFLSEAQRTEDADTRPTTDRLNDAMARITGRTGDAEQERDPDGKFSSGGAVAAHHGYTPAKSVNGVRQSKAQIKRQGYAIHEHAKEYLTESHYGMSHQMQGGHTTHKKVYLTPQEMHEHLSARAAGKPSPHGR